MKNSAYIKSMKEEKTNIIKRIIRFIKNFNSPLRATNINKDGVNEVRERVDW